MRPYPEQMSMMDRIRGHIHRLMFRKHGKFVDFLRRLLWLSRHERKFGFSLAVSFVSLVVGVIGLSGAFIADSWRTLGTTIALLLFLATLTVMVLDWIGHTNKSESLVSIDVAHPEDFEYLPPYGSWQNTPLRGGPGWRHDDDVDRWLFADPVVTLVNDGRWFPRGHAADLRVRWGGKRRRFNEWKIRLASEFRPNMDSVTIQRTDYVSYIVTNNLALKYVRESTTKQPALTFDDVELVGDAIPPFSRSHCSNHLGGDLLVIGPGVVWLTHTNHRNFVGGQEWAASASGSFDWDLEGRKHDDLIGLVKAGLLRELAEESGFRGSAAPEPANIRIVRFGRATYAGGKPQFLALCRYPTLDPDLSKGDTFSDFVEPVEFIPERGLAGLVDALDDFRDSGNTLNRPLTMCLELLRELSCGKGNQEVDQWLTESWSTGLSQKS